MGLVGPGAGELHLNDGLGSFLGTEGTMGKHRQQQAVECLSAIGLSWCLVWHVGVTIHGRNQTNNSVPSHLSQSASSSRIRLMLERDCRLPAALKKIVHARTLALFSKPNIFYKQMVNCSGIRRLKHLRILILNLQHLSLLGRSELLVLQNSIAKTIKHAEVSSPQ